MAAHLREPENVVDEEEHILALLVTEILGDREAGEGDTGPGAGGLVHLSVHQRHLPHMYIRELNKLYKKWFINIRETGTKKYR